MELHFGRVPKTFRQPPVPSNWDRDNPDNIEIYSADRAHTLYSAYKYEYVVIDGVRCGKSPALYAWYDKGKNAFIWNAVEGR
jgi:hypothetical protein